MVAARAALVLDEPYWGPLALKLQLVEDPTCKTAWVDGQSLGFNPRYIDSIHHPAELKALVAHEVGHCVLGHPWRRNGRELGRWNEAGDRALNPVLRDAKFHLPEGVLYEFAPDHKGKSAEWIHNRLPVPPPAEDEDAGSGSGGDASEAGEEDDDQQQQSPGADAGEEPGDDSADEGEEGDQQAAGGDAAADGDEEQDGDDFGSPQEFGGEVRDAPVGTEEDDDVPTEEDWQVAAQQAATMAAAQGKLPGSVERMVEQATQARVDWRSVTRRFIQEAASLDYSWAQPDPCYVGQDLYLPALVAEELGPLAIFIDTSGSIDNTLLGIFGAEFQAAVDEARPRRVYVLYCDSRVQHEDVFERGEVVEFHARGGGGTDFRPAFEAIDGFEEPPVAVFYLTDLRGSFPAEPPDMPTLWITPKRYAQEKVPFGEIVAVD
jgi:predicted metal-dependent peptidase